MTNKIPSIRGFQNVFKDMCWLANDPSYSGNKWVSKVKLHGTNAGIRIEADGTVTAQKKTDDIFPGDDNFGFALFVEAMKSQYGLVRLARDVFGPNGWSNITVLGEWAGPGIQKGVAVSQIEEKHFFPFAVLVNRKEHGGVHELHYDSHQWSDFMEFFNLIDRVCPIDTADAEVYECNARQQTSVQFMMDKINERVLKIEERDPFIDMVFDIRGVGEGLVFYPVVEGQNGWCSKDQFASLGFKVKGEKHSVSNAGKPARIKSKIPDSAYEFADMHCPEPRLEQGLQEVGSLDSKNMGPFIQWVCRDILKECALEIEESGLDWKKQLSGVIATKARHWFFEQQKTRLVA